MDQNAPPAQESKSERAAVALTPSEKRAVRAIAAVRGTDESNLIRTTPVAEIVAEFRRLLDGEMARKRALMREDTKRTLMQKNG